MPRGVTVASSRANAASGAAFVAPALIFLLLFGRLWWLPAHAPLDVNEGWNAMQAMRAWGSGHLYPSPDALTANNYPPLSFYVVGAVGRVVGDDIVAGRLVAALAQIFTGTAVFALVGRFVAGMQWRWIGVLFFSAFSATFLRRYVAMDDPQWLAEAAMAWALVLVQPGRPCGPIPRGAVALSALLVVLGLLTKHNAVAFPLVIVVWLTLADRVALAIWCATGMLLALVAGAVIVMTWGILPFTDLIHTCRSHSLGRMITKGGLGCLVILPGLVTCAPLWRLGKRSVTRVPILLLCIAVPLGVIQCAGDGVDVNAFFEAVVALSVALPVACSIHGGDPRRRMALAAIPIIILVPVATAADIGELVGRDAAVQHWSGFITRVAAAPDPVACDDQAVCYWARRDAGMDFFILKQRLLHNRGQNVIEAIRSHHFTEIEMRTNDPGWHSDLIRPLIWSRYRRTYTADNIALFVPASSRSSIHSTQ